MAKAAGIISLDAAVAAGIPVPPAAPNTTQANINKFFGVEGPVASKD